MKPPQVSGTPDHPWLQFLQVDQEVRPGGGNSLGTTYIRKGGMATVDTDTFWLRGSLDPAPDAAWYATHLKLEGMQPMKQFQPPAGGSRFEWSLPAGQPGDAFRLRLQDVLLADGTRGDVSVTFCRQRPPQVAVSYQGPDGWHPAEVTVPNSAPLRLRLTFTNDMLKESVERALTGPHDKEGHSEGAWISSLHWIDARTLELQADHVPPVLRFVLQGAQDKNGLFTTRGLPNLYTGETPQVVAVDPTSGQARLLAAIPPEPQGGILSPDGKRVRLASLQAGRSARSQHLLVDLGTGKSQALQPDAMYGYWLTSGEWMRIERQGENGLLVTRESPAGPQQTLLNDVPPYDSFYGSPDGKWVAVLVRTGDYTPDGYLGVRFLFLSTDGKTRKTLTGDARVWRPGKDGLRLYGPAWSPDSTRIALAQTDHGASSLVVADVTADAPRTVAHNLPRSDGSATLWSPDGTQILVGSLLLDATTGQVQRRLTGSGLLPYWSRDGQWRLLQAGEWEPITAYNLRTGASTPLGPGLALGWDVDGKALIIRWADAASRTIFGI